MKEDLDTFLREKVWNSTNTGSKTKSVVLAEPELFGLPDGSVCLQIGKAILGRKAFVDFGLGTEEDYYSIIRKLCSTQSDINSKTKKATL